METCEIIELARSWVGTPYCHQASLKGCGADCLGLVRGVWRDLLGCEPEFSVEYTADWAEASGEERLWSAARRYMSEKPAEGRIEDGDVLLFRMRDNGVAKHLGIASSRAEGRTFIHSYHRHGVVESSLTDPWKRRIAAVFSYPLGD